MTHEDFVERMDEEYSNLVTIDNHIKIPYSEFIKLLGMAYTVGWEHKVSKKFSIDKENKLIIDYKANENFTTKSAELNNTSFKKVVIGNHTKENFFRIAIELTEKPSKYNVEYKDNLIIISKIN